MPDHVLVTPAKPGVVLVSLNRPERRNALSIPLLTSLTAILSQLADDDTTRVVILAAAGPVFSAGLDLAEAADGSLLEESARQIKAALVALQDHRLVTIAAVQGGAYAGGAGLMAACDLAVGADDVQIGFPEGRRGLVAALVGDVLCAKVRKGEMAELFLLGTPIDARRAREIGLLQRVVPAGRLLDEALAMADAVLAGGPEAIARTKVSINTAYSDAADPLLSESHHRQARQSDEAAEGLAAFLAKRPPRWQP